MKKIPTLKLMLLTALVGGVCSLSAQPVGQWDFDGGNLAATTGSALTYKDGAAGPTATATMFGTTTALGIADINGSPAQVMKFPGSPASGGFLLPFASAPNGGGTFVNQWTIIMDVYFPASSDGVVRALMDTDARFLTADADLKVSETGGLGAYGNFAGTIAADTWYRIALVVDNTEGPSGTLRKYINGQLVGTQSALQNSATAIDGNWALDPATGAELFNDDNGEVAPGYVNSIQLRNVALSTAEIAAFGGPAAAGIPAVIPDIPSFVVSWKPAGVFARTAQQLGLVMNPGSSQLSNITLELGGNVLPSTATPNGEGLIEIMANTVSNLTPLQDYTLKVAYTDSKDGQKMFTHNFRVPFLFEDFEELVLGSPVEEPGLVGLEEFENNAFTHISPDGWSVDRSGVPGWDGVNFTNDGRTEWAGWSFANKEFWVASDNQGRSGFDLGTGTLAIADPDEWDDGPHAPSAENGWFKTYMFTPSIDISAVGPDSVFVRFDSSWNPEFDDNYHQTARLRVRFDGGDWQDVFIWESDSTSPRYKASAINETLNIPLFNPQGAASMELEFGMYDAGNDWWWAIDNVVVDAGAIPPSFTSQPRQSIRTVGESATFSVELTGTEPFTYQWFKGTGENRTAISGAVNSTFTIPFVSMADTGVYSVDVSNSAATLSSANALLFVVPVAAPSGDVAGQWDFDAGDLRATVGGDLVYLDGPSGDTAAQTAFNTTTGFGIPNIGGSPANVMRFASANGLMGYVGAVGGPNGDPAATRKNVYSLVFDILWPAAANAKWRTFVQIDSLDNADDAEFFVNTANGIGISGNYTGTIQADTWHRVVFVVNQTAGVQTISKYIDGVQVGVQASAALDGRFGLPAAVNFFADNDGDTQVGYVNSLQVRNTALTALEVSALGGAKAGGIPLTIDTSLAKPVIVSQPVGVFLSPGGSVTLAVNAQSGLPATYQWYLGGVEIPGANSASLVIGTALSSDAGSYTVKVTNANGEITSTAAIVSFPTDISQDLVAHLPFDSNANDTSGRGNNGTAVGTVSYVEGVLGQALRYSTAADGSSFNYVTLGAPADLNFGQDTDFSVSFWTKFSEWAGDPAIIGNKNWNSGGNPGWVIATAGDARVQWNIAPTRADYDSPGGVLGADWHHVVVTFDRNGLITTYVDGNQIDARPNGAARNVDTPSGQATNIGQDGAGAYTDGGSVGIADGTIDDVGIWRRLLTAAEARAIFLGGIAGKGLDKVTGETLGTMTTTPVLNGTSLQFDWRGQPGAKLQRSVSINGPWTDVPGSEGANTVTVPLGSGNEYFRLLRSNQ